MAEKNLEDLLLIQRLAREGQLAREAHQPKTRVERNTRAGQLRALIDEKEREVAELKKEYQLYRGTYNRHEEIDWEDTGNTAATLLMSSRVSFEGAWLDGPSISVVGDVLAASAVFLQLRLPATGGKMVFRGSTGPGKSPAQRPGEATSGPRQDPSRRRLSPWRTLGRVDTAPPHFPARRPAGPSPISGLRRSHRGRLSRGNSGGRDCG